MKTPDLDGTSLPKIFYSIQLEQRRNFLRLKENNCISIFNPISFSRYLLKHELKEITKYEIKKEARKQIKSPE